MRTRLDFKKSRAGKVVPCGDREMMPHGATQHGVCCPPPPTSRASVAVRLPHAWHEYTTHPPPQQAVRYRCAVLALCVQLSATNKTETRDEIVTEGISTALQVGPPPRTKLGPPTAVFVLCFVLEVEATTAVRISCNDSIHANVTAVTAT